MIKSSKIANSLPKDDLVRIEKVRKELGLQRSVIIDIAIRYWLDHIEKKKIIKQYEEGYKNKPELISELKALELLSADAFKEEGLK